MIHTTTAERLRFLMQTRNLRQIDILRAALPYARELGVKLNRSDISQYLSGKVVPGQDKLMLLGKALRVNPVWLMGIDVPMAQDGEAPRTQPGEAPPAYPGIVPIRSRRIVPVIGSAACGEPIYKPGDGTEFVEAGPDIQCDFALIAEGDSMIGDRIRDGDVVFIRGQADASDGAIVAVAIDDEVMLKHIYHSRDAHGNLSAQFVSSNPKYAPIVVGGENETRRVAILGKAVAFTSAL